MMNNSNIATFSSDSSNYKYFFVILSLLFFSSVFLYWHVFIDLVGIWNEKEEYSHGFIIPFLSFYLLWQKKEAILAEKFSPSWWGVIISILAMILYFIGTVGDVYFLLRFSYILLLIGMVLSVFGVKTTHLMLVPILFISFSFPLPPVLQATLTAKLQLISSQLGVSLIHACRIPVFLEGNIIDLGDYKLQVVEACSGLRYLFPLMSLAFICAYMYHVAFWKRAIVFLTSIPVTVFMNSFRIGVIGILVDNWGISMAEGFIHDFEGWIVFMACFLVLFFEMWVLSWNERQQKGWGDVFGLVVSTTESRSSSISFSTNLYPSIAILLGILVTIATIKPLGERDDVIPPRKQFYSFPTQLSNWSGHADTLDKNTIDFLGLSDYILLNFSSPTNNWINFYVAYYETQKHGAVPHSPKLCIPGGGWEISEISEFKSNNIDLNRAIIAKGNNRQLVYYWYRQKGKNIANEYLFKWNTFLNSFKYQRTDGALIRLTTPIAPDESINLADQRLQQFMMLIDNQISSYVPD